MITIDPLAWYVTAFVVVGVLTSFAIRWRMNIKAQKNSLWKQITDVLQSIQGERKKASTLWVKYRLLLQKVKYPAEKIKREIENLDRQTEGAYQELYQTLFEPVPKRWWFLWKYWVALMYEESDPKSFYRPPSHSVNDLRALFANLKELDKTMKHFVRRLEYATTPHPRTGLTPIEFRSTMLEGQDRAEEKRGETQDLYTSYLEARETLSNVYMYLENRQNPRSLEAAGETPVTAGASVLTFDMIQKFWKSKVKELEEVEAGGVSAELVQKVSSLRETLKLFPSKAETVADAERRYHNVIATVEQLSKENAIEIVLPERLGKVEGLLKGLVANAWAEADWNTLAESIKEVHASLFHVEKELEKLQLWGLSVDRLALRIRTIMDVESFLEEAHEVVVRDTKNWGRRADFEAEVLQAWAGIDETAYESAKKKLDTALDLREQMLINRIGELITEKSGVLPQETITKLRVFQDNLALKSESRKSSRASGDKRASADSMEDWAPAPRLSGELVEITTETGLRISVDKSLVSHYEKRWSADVEDKQKDDENRPKNPMDGLRKARERYLKTKGG